MSVKAGKIIAVLEKLAPSQLQAGWDNSGLQVGSRQWPADKVLLALDVTPEVVIYAAENGYNFILAHHPMLFNKVGRIDASTPLGQMIAHAMSSRITIFAMHTNLDVIRGGVSDVLSDLLSLEQVEILDRQKGDYHKLAIFVPATHLDQVRKAVGDAGAGGIGNYSHCSFAGFGQGRFLPGEGANPWLGTQGTIQEADEYKLETIVEGHKVKEVLAAMRSVHPYEEVAYDLIPMANDAEYGLGRLGTLPEPVSLSDFADKVGCLLRCSALKVCGDCSQQIKRVAVCGGSGGKYVGLSHLRGADVLVTGDIGHHEALEAKQLGLALVDPGHYSSEYPVMILAEDYLRQVLAKDVEVARFPGSTDPLRIVAVNS